MTDEQSVIFLGRRIQELHEPKEILVWEGAAWVAQPNPSLMAGIVNIPNWITVPINQWNTVTPAPAPADPIVPQFIGIDLATEPEKKKHSDGCACKKCKEYFPYAEPNQDDGSLICYACRHGL